MGIIQKEMTPNTSTPKHISAGNLGSTEYPWTNSGDYNPQSGLRYSALAYRTYFLCPYSELLARLSTFELPLCEGWPARVGAR